MSILDVDTYAEALDFINNNPGLNESQLRQIMSQMSTSVDGATSAILYSSVVGGNGNETVIQAGLVDL
jgi:hypothetical protein